MRFCRSLGACGTALASGNWLGVWSGGIYLPLELYEALRHPSWLHASLAATANLLVVLYLVKSLARHEVKS
ncbi:DUF2127 domain-containing protein [Cupriavidus basilensis]